MPSEFSVRSDSVDVEQIMGRIRARIREKRGVDYTEDELRELANVKIERFLDPTRVRSDLLAHYLKSQEAAERGAAPEAQTGTEGEAPAAPPAPGLMTRITRKLTSPYRRMSRKLKWLRHAQSEQRLNFILIHNMVLEITRLGIEVRNLKMRVESLSSRLDFNERRARAMEHVVQYRPGAGQGAGPTVEPPRIQAGQRPPDRRRDHDREQAERRREASQAERRREPNQAERRREPDQAEPLREAGPAEGRREPEQTEGPAKGEAQRRRRRRRRGRGASGGGQGEAGGPAQAGVAPGTGDLSDSAGPVDHDDRPGQPVELEASQPVTPERGPEPASDSPSSPDRHSQDQ